MFQFIALGLPPAQIQVLPLSSDFSSKSESLTEEISEIEKKILSQTLVESENQPDKIHKQVLNYQDFPENGRRVSKPQEHNIYNEATLLGETLSVDSFPSSLESEKIVKRKISRLVIQDNQGENLEIELSTDIKEKDNNQTQEITQATEESVSIPIEEIDIIEVFADQQEYNQEQEIIQATGNVTINFARGILTADKLQISLSNRLAVAQGNVILTRGDQILRGERFEYYFVQDRGTIINASGEIFQPSIDRDFSGNLATEPGRQTIPELALNDSLSINQPLQRVTTAEGYRFTIGSSRSLNRIAEQGGLPARESVGRINRFRFEASQLEFDGGSWNAIDVRLTNDPFSPPELVVRADSAQLNNLAPGVEELNTTNSRIVFDSDLSLPIFQDRLVFDSRPRRPSIISVGFDGEDRGGLFVERSFNFIDTQNISFTVSPQYFFQRGTFPDALGVDDDREGTAVFDASTFGVNTELDIVFTPRTTFQSNTEVTSFDGEEISDEIRSSSRLEQKIGNLNNPYSVSLQYNFRDRLFNGSLGFQTVQNSFGLVAQSPDIFIGNSNFKFNYQASFQRINAETDLDEFLDPFEEEDLVTLNRFQTAASLSNEFFLWKGQSLEPNSQEGLRYTPVPILPFLRLTAGLTGVSSFYSNGDTQPNLRGTIGLQGQVGNFSRRVLDYTGFNISYSQSVTGDISPFLFDRFVDQETLSLGITQQIYGPLRAGVQTSFNIDNGDPISTDYFLEYSRRTYNVLIRFNPVLEIGSVSLRISDFNWVGDTQPFSGANIDTVIQGVTR